MAGGRPMRASAAKSRSLVANDTLYEIELNWTDEVDFHSLCQCFDTGDFVNESSHGCDATSSWDSTVC